MAFDDQMITDESIRRLNDTPEPRLRETMNLLIRHLHAFVRDDEWSSGDVNKTSLSRITLTKYCLTLLNYVDGDATLDERLALMIAI